MSSTSRSAPLSVVIASHNEGNHLRQTVDSILASLPSNGEIIVVDDASTDNSTDALTYGYAGVTVLRPARHLGAARARNYGAHAAHGSNLVFADAHVATDLGWWPPLASALINDRVGAVGPAISAIGQPAAIGYGMQIRGPDLSVEWLGPNKAVLARVPVLGAGFLAMRREVFVATGGFDAGMIGWGLEDVELSIRLWLLGYEMRIVPGVEVAHLFRAAHPYSVEWRHILQNTLRLAFKHFNTARLARVLDAVKDSPDFVATLAQLSDSDVWKQRAELKARRVHDDDWYFASFNMLC
jgi:GT2 family glycosyltransferase